MRYLLYDGYNLAFRAFYGMPELRRSDGFLTNAIHGWLRTLWMLQDQEQPDREIAFFDLGESKRAALLPEYKANRKETPEGFAEQVPWMRRIAEALGVAVVEEEGVEADDLMASLACRLAKEGHEVLLVSADKDLGQVVSDRILQLLPPPTANPRLGWKRLDPAGVEKKFGVKPEGVADYLALVGDASDNIPGLKGVGPKTAAKWLQEYGDLETTVSKANYLSPPRFQSLVAAEADNLRRNLAITRLDLASADHFELPVDPQPSLAEMREIFTELEMKRALSDCEKRYG